MYAPDVIKNGLIDEDSSSSDEVAKPTNYVPSSSGSPVKLLSHSEKRKVLSVPMSKNLFKRKYQGRKKDEPLYKELEEVERESDHTITLKT